jgi:polysaccharide deacetylase 2 family uncharacterized protein YibQ
MAEPKQRDGWGGRWRGLILFWVLVLVVLGAGGVAVQVAGPPPHAAVPPPGQPDRSAGVTEPDATPAKPIIEAASTAAQAIPTQRPGRAVAGPIAAPDPALQEPAPERDGGMLPRIASDGRTPGQIYARGFAAEPGRPRIGLILAGIGLNEADSAQAARALPAEVTLAVSPYAPQPASVLPIAREMGHEMLLSIPMEPQGFPLNDPGNHALLTDAAPAENARSLNWALGRFAGYAGTTGALGNKLNGERFQSLPEQMDPVLATLAARGLFYVDPRPGQPALAHVWSRAIDLMVDETSERAAIEAKLAELEHIARDKGSALGLVGTPSPVAIERIAAWASGINERGFSLAPASALMRAPAGAMQ